MYCYNLVLSDLSALMHDVLLQFGPFWPFCVDAWRTVTTWSFLTFLHWCMMSCYSLVFSALMHEVLLQVSILCIDAWCTVTDRSFLTFPCCQHDALLELGHNRWHKWWVTDRIRIAGVRKVTDRIRITEMQWGGMSHWQNQWGAMSHGQNQNCWGVLSHWQNHNHWGVTSHWQNQNHWGVMSHWQK